MRPSPTFGVAKKAAAKKAAGETVYDFSVGQPSEPTPAFIRKQLTDLIGDAEAWKTMSQYSPVNGLPALKKNIAYKLQDENGLTYSSDEILVSNGGKQAIFNAFAVTLQKGDHVLMAEPSWVSYADMVKWQGAEPVGIPTRDDFKFTADALKMKLAFNPEVKWIVINSPSNPTGATYTLEEMQAIADVVLAENKRRLSEGKAPVMVMSDDIYEHMVYEDKYLNKAGDKSAVSNNIVMANPDMKPYTVIINGMAKAFAMTGWRVGYAAGPKALIDKMGEFQGLTTSGVSAISQLAANIALDPKNKEPRENFFSEQRASYIQRRDKVAELIADAGLEFKPTPGAFYAMVDASALLGKKLPDGKEIKNSHDIANFLIEKHGVATVPGDDFFIEPDKKQSFVRMSYATSMNVIEKGIDAIKGAVSAILPQGRDEGKGRG